MKSVSSVLRTGIGILGSALAVCCLALAAPGCKQDEAPPPLPEAKPAPTPTTLELAPPEEEDAGAEEEKPKPTGKGGAKAGGALSACCAALRQNAASAPPETAGHMLNAASLCDAANATGTKAGFLATLGGLLKGAGIPAACK